MTGSSFFQLFDTHNSAKEFVTQAVDSLAPLQESEAKDILIETARFVAHRTI